MRLASVCRHWQTAATRAASGQLFCSCSSGRISLPVHSLTPALKHYTRHWEGLDVILHSRGVPARLDNFMRSMTQTQLGLYSAGVPEARDLVALQRALTLAPAVRFLLCNVLLLDGFPWSLTHLNFRPSIKWANRELEAVFQRLALLPRLAYITVTLSDCEVLLSEDRLADLELPNLCELQLQLHEHNEELGFDLSWLSYERDFRFCLVLCWDNSDDRLFDFCCRIETVLGCDDSLMLKQCSLICEPAQQVLGRLELREFQMRVSSLFSIVMLPAAEEISLEIYISSTDIKAAEEDMLDFGHETPPFVTQLSWLAVTSATEAFQATLDLTQVQNSRWADCPVHLHVSDAPVDTTAWQQSLIDPDIPWVCSLRGWQSVIGMPPATRFASDVFELEA